MFIGRYESYMSPGNILDIDNNPRVFQWSTITQCYNPYSFVQGYFLINLPFESRLPMICYTNAVNIDIQASAYRCHTTYWGTKVKYNITEIRINCTAIQYVNFLYIFGKTYFTENLKIFSLQCIGLQAWCPIHLQWLRVGQKHHGTK